jgi:hypothetical protein
MGNGMSEARYRVSAGTVTELPGGQAGQAAP